VTVSTRLRRPVTGQEFGQRVDAVHQDVGVLLDHSQGVRSHRALGGAQRRHRQRRRPVPQGCCNTRQTFAHLPGQRRQRGDRRCDATLDAGVQRQRGE
jgi:hypothetical protein